MREVLAASLLALLLVLAGPATAQTSVVVTPSVNAALWIENVYDSRPKALVIYDNDTNQLVVSIALKDGAVTFGPGFSPDQAARKAWEVLAQAYGAGRTERDERACLRLLFPSLSPDGRVGP